MNRFAVAAAWLLATSLSLTGCNQKDSPRSGQDKQAGASQVAQGQQKDSADKAGAKDTGKPAVAGNGKTPSPVTKPPVRKSKAKSNEEVRKICELLAGDPEKREREEALDRLEKLNPDLFPHVVSLTIETPGSFSHRGAIGSISNLEKKASDALPLVMKEWQRLGKACAKQGGKTFEFDHPLMNSLTDVAVAMQRIAPDDPAVIEAISQGTTMKEAVRQRMFLILRDVAKDDDDMTRYLLPVFVAGLGDDDRDVKTSVMTILGEFGPLAKDSVVTLRPLRFDEDAGIRTAAIEALKKIDVE